MKTPHLRAKRDIAESLFGQLQLEPHRLPRWIVVGAGTGGTWEVTVRPDDGTAAHDPSSAVLSRTTFVPVTGLFGAGWGRVAALDGHELGAWRSRDRTSAWTRAPGR